MEKNFSRREIFQKTAVGSMVGGALSKMVMASAALCGLTPKQAEGPFYPEKNQEDKDWDLTVKKGATGHLIKNGIYGTPLYLRGIVQNERCEPIPGALVEIWQACATGRYNHSGDTSGLPIDPNFQYWGRATTNSKGEYLFKTILPGDYPADTNWQRPPHIHFKVYAMGYLDLTSQLYFSGKSFGGGEGRRIDELNALDAILSRVPASERDRVIVDFEESIESPELGIKLGSFPITVKKV